MICLFGGTFDPVHYGHLHGAATVCDALQLTEIHLVLAARPGHRQAPVAAAEHRWQMLCLGCADDPRLVPDDGELLRDGPSYTVETLIAARERAPAATVLWVLGIDAFVEISSWWRWTRVLELANLVVLKRPGEDLRPDPELEILARERRVAGRPNTRAGRILFLEDPMQDISASQIRAALAAGGSVDHLLPKQVATYITRHGLYGVPRDA